MENAKKIGLKETPVREGVCLQLYLDVCTRMCGYKPGRGVKEKRKLLKGVWY